MRDIGLSQEIERIEKNSHAFLRYFGIFWGAILIFIVQSYKDNTIATIIGDFIVKISLSPFETVNFFAGLFLWLGLVSILASFIFLIANSVSTSVLAMNSGNSSKYVIERREFLEGGVRSGVIGSILIFIFLAIALLSQIQALEGLFLLIGKIIFWIAFILIFMVDPIVLMVRKVWGWTKLILNLAFSFYLGFYYIFYLMGISSSETTLFFAFLVVFYFPIRLINSIVKEPYFFAEYIFSFLPNKQEKEL